HSALGANLRGDAFERHDGDGSGFGGDGGLTGVGNVHDDAALEHFGEAGLEAERGGRVLRVAVGFRHFGLFSRSRRMGAWRAVLTIYFTTAEPVAPILLSRSWRKRVGDFDFGILRKFFGNVVRSKSPPCRIKTRQGRGNRAIKISA